MANKMVIPGPGEEPNGAQHEKKRQLLNWDLLFDFRAMVAELEETEGIVDVHWRMHDPIPNFTIETIEHGLGVTVPHRVRSFYEVSDGLEFSWNYVIDGEKHAGGGAHLFDFATVFDNWLDSLWLGEVGQDAEDEDFLWSLRGFDQHSHPDFSDMIVLCVEEEYPTYDLFLHDLDQRSSELLELSFREYFDFLLETRGVYGWQFLLSEHASADDPRAEHFFEVVEHFFPDVDLTRFSVD